MVKNTYRSVYLSAVDALENGEIENAGFDGAVMFEEAFGVDYKTFRYSSDFDNEPDGKDLEKFVSMIKRRITGEPLQYIIGKWEFYGMEMMVGEGVLVPRQDTETLVDTVIKKSKGKKDLEIVDLCAGTGCIGLALEKHLDVKKLTFVENSLQASSYLEKNIARHGSRGEIIMGDVLSKNTLSWINQADIVVSNPPYLTKDDMDNLQTEVGFEPKQALFGGEDGLDFYRDITRLWKNKLKDGGLIAFEIGIGQENDVSEILIRHGFKNVRFYPDANDIFRVVTGENIELYTD